MRTFAWLMPVYRAHAWKLAAVLLLTLVYTPLHLAYPFIIGMVLDDLSADLSRESIARNAGLLAAVGAASVLLYAGLQAGRAWVNIGAERMIRRRVFDRLTLLGDSFFCGNSSGDIITRLTNDISEKIAWFSCSGVFRMVEAVLVISMALALMFALSWKLTLIAALPLPVILFAFRMLRARFKRGYELVQKAASRQNEVLEAALSGMKVVKSCADEDSQAARYAAAAASRVAAEVRMAAMDGLFHRLGSLIGECGMIVLLFAGAHMVLDGSLSVGKLVTFSIYMAMIVEPIWSIGFFLPALRRADVSVGRLIEIENAARDVEDSPAAVDLPAGARDAAFENISYSHSSGAGVRGISLAAGPGSRLGLVGGVGSGKSTLLEMLPRAHEPEQGRVVVGGRDVRDWTLKSLRRAIGYVPQDPFLFSASLRENILLGRDNVPEEDLRRAARASMLEADLSCFPGGIDEVVGPRGTTLSGGQKQRVSLARALAGSPSILALDDVTSNLDSETEEELWRRVESEFPGVTVIAISHRAATARRMDRLAVLSAGEVIEQGTHEELLDAGGEYAALFKRQVLRDTMGS